MSLWGTIWTSAMGQTFSEAHELVTGARLARRLSLPAEAVEVSPGSIIVRDPDDAWVAQLGLRQLDDGQWETILRTAAAEPQLMAAVITGELPIELHGKAVALGCSFVPEPGDVGADCSCPDWHEPCRHVGALVAIVAELIDADPWLLVMLRGRSRDQVVETVRRLRSEQRGIEWVDAGDEPRGADPGVAAAAAFRAAPSSLPSALPPLRRAARPVAHQAPPADAGVRHDDLGRLAADAAARAFELLSGSDDADALAVSVTDDIARIAAALEAGDPRWHSLAAAGDVPVDQLRRLAAGWALAGSAGVTAVTASVDLTPQQRARGGAALTGARTSRSAITGDECQLRVDDHGRWWCFVRDDALGWVIADGPGTDPNDVLVR